MNENIEKKLLQLAYNNLDREIIKVLKMEMKGNDFKHQFEFLFWITENRNLEIFRFLTNEYPQIDIHLFEDFCF